VNRVLAHTGARYPIVRASMGLMTPDALKGIRDVYFHDGLATSDAVAHTDVLRRDMRSTEPRRMAASNAILL